VIHIRRDAGCEWLATELYELMEAQPDAVLGVATGSSPEAVYTRVTEKLLAHPLDVSGISAFALDEYVGIPNDHPESYHSFIDSHITVPWGLNPQRVHVPESAAGDDGIPVHTYDDAIAAAGGVDLQILGIGHNGHIGFNEPGTPFSRGTHVQQLTPRTREANARFFDGIDDVPRSSVTQGPATILRARRIVLLAYGASKAEAVAAAVEGPVTQEVPASVLQRHPNVTFVLDEGAASLLS
jgi:glucosamine-6-phosphate deaminase